MRVANIKQLQREKGKCLRASSAYTTGGAAGGSGDDGGSHDGDDDGDDDKFL